MDEASESKMNGVIANGDSAGTIDVSDEPKSKLVEYNCQSADITEDSSKIKKFSSKLKENAGVENGREFREKDYEESAQKSMQEKHGKTNLACSSSLQLAEKEKVSKTQDGGVKAEYVVGSDEQYKCEASAKKKAGEGEIETHRSSDSRYSKACAKIDEELPAGAGGGKRSTQASKAEYSHAERIASSITAPGGAGVYKTQGNLEEHSSDQHSHTAVTTPSGSSLHISSRTQISSKKESFRMEGSGENAPSVEDGGAASTASAIEDNDAGASAPAEAAPASTTSADLGRPNEIKLSTKISSDDGDLLATASAGAAATSATSASSSKYEHVSASSTTQKETTETSGAALYNRQGPPDATPSDNMSVSSMSSAHEQNDVKMSSASSSESAFSANKMDTSDLLDKGSKYNRKTTDSLVKKILGESDAERKSKYKINMAGEGEDETELDRDSLLQRRLASLDKTDRKAGGIGARRGAGDDLYMSEEYEHEETTYSRRRGRANKQGSGDLDSPRRLGRPGSRGSRGSFEFEDDYDDLGYGSGYGPPAPPGYGQGYGPPPGYRGGRGRFARQHYIDDEEVFGPPVVPLFRDDEFIPEKRAETEEYVKEKTANIRGMVDRQTVVLENLRKASESFDELTDEIKNIRQAFIENQAKRAMIFREGELPVGPEDDQGPRAIAGGPQRARSRYVQQSEEDYEFAMRGAGARGRKPQYGGPDDLGYDSPARSGRQRYGLEGDKDDFTVSLYGGKPGARDKDQDDFGPRSLGSYGDYGALSSYGKSRGLDNKLDDYSSTRTQMLKKSSYYSQDDYSASSAYGGGDGSSSYNSRRLRGLGARSKSLYDEASGGDHEGYSGLDDAAGASGRRGRLSGGTAGLQRTLHDPLSEDVTSSKDRYVSPYGSTAAGGYTRLGDSTSSTTSSAYGAGRTSSYTSSRLTSSSLTSSTAAAGSSASATRPRFSRSRTLSDIDYDRGSVSDTQTGFQSRFLGKVRQKSAAGEDVSRRDKPFKSRFLRSSFDLGDGSSDASSSYTSTSAAARLNSSRSSATSESTTTKETTASDETSKE